MKSSAETFEISMCGVVSSKIASHQAGRQTLLLPQEGPEPTFLALSARWPMGTAGDGLCGRGTTHRGTPEQRHSETEGPKDRQ